MSESSTPIRRAFEAEGSFERIDGSTWNYTTTAFDGRVTVDRSVDGGAGTDGVDAETDAGAADDVADTETETTVAETDPTTFEVVVTVPTLSAVTDEHVADVVEDGWFETFELRVADVSGVTKRSREFDPSVRRAGSEIVVTATITDVNARRGVADAAAFIDFVEGTYVQGIIPGYDYTEPVTEILSKARQQGNAGGF
ncbi:DUF5813 family protein [Halopenitus persicus]|uniref:Uncharacterized protein n=1 Tax=Halopenitus persicus TaxID=1048396 RepID=A0A1H3KIR2_9EURY|nr:DUF5813 family protein [Halopenitus persicus]SDY51949.1 hypothetical protein SAMN05216564_10632 [Halopenitus persicus]